MWTECYFIPPLVMLASFPSEKWNCFFDLYFKYRSLDTAQIVVIIITSVIYFWGCVLNINAWLEKTNG